MKIVKYVSSILLVLLLLSPIVAADEYAHTLGGRLAPSIEENEVTPWIENEINIWKASAVEQLNANAPHLNVVPEDFQFDTPKSVEEFVDRTNIPWYAFWRNKQEVHQPIDVTLSDRFMNALDQDPAIDMVQTSTELQIKASVLSNEPLLLVSSSISVSDMERIAFVNQQTGLPSAELEAFIELINDKVLQPQEIFSLNEILSQGTSPISEDTANFVASMLYISILQTEFAIIERHSQGVVPSYTSLGLEAMVNSKLQRDFQIKNTLDAPVTMNASITGGVFLLEFYSLGADSTATFEVGAREEIEPKRIERLVADLAYGAERRVQAGQSGWRVTTFRIISSKTGSFETQEVVARDYYPPIHSVYEVSTQPAPPEATTPTDGQSPGDTPVINPDGSIANPDGSVTNPDGTVSPADPNGSTGGSGSPGTGTPGTGNESGSGGSGTGGNGSTDDDTTPGSGSGTGDSPADYDKGGNKID